MEHRPSKVTGPAEKDGPNAAVENAAHPAGHICSAGAAYGRYNVFVHRVPAARTLTDEVGKLHRRGRKGEGPCIEGWATRRCMCLLPVLKVEMRSAKVGGARHPALMQVVYILHRQGRRPSL